MTHHSERVIIGNDPHQLSPTLAKIPHHRARRRRGLPPVVQIGDTARKPGRMTPVHTCSVARFVQLLLSGLEVLVAQQRHAI